MTEFPVLELAVPAARQQELDGKDQLDDDGESGLFYGRQQWWLMVYDGNNSQWSMVVNGGHWSMVVNG